VKKLLALLFSLWTGAATAGVPCSLPFNLQNNTIADATQVMANYNALVTCLGNAAASGANSDITGLFGLTSPLGPTFGGANTFYGSSSVGTNSYAVTVLPNTFTLTTGFMVSFTVGATNTSAATLTVNSGATTNLFRATPTGPVAMTGGELVSGNRVLAGYDGTQWQLLSPSIQVGGFGPLTTLASATTTDLGTVPSHNIQITGSTTITSFGASAITAYPVYKLEFLNAPLLTNSGALQLIGGANIQTAVGDTAEMLYSGAGSWFMLSYSRISGLPVAPLTTPTVQRFTSGTGTYTPTTGTVRIKVRMAAGGGGGGSSSGAAGTSGGNGGNSSFGSWTTVAGTGGSIGSATLGGGGVGGSGGTNGTGVLVVRVSGANGSSGGGTGSTGGGSGGTGGTNPFGGAGGGGGQNALTGTGAAANTGAGGGGGGGGANLVAGGGGGAAGEYVEFYVGSPIGTPAWTVGGGGAGGSGGSVSQGGAGAAGLIVIEEFYQ
jgi:hypothetical protein